MPVNTVHRLYTDMIAQWERCRDVYEGGDAVKARGSLYLPVLEGQSGGTDTGYVGYLQRALFYPAMARTIYGLAGLIFGKPPTTENFSQQYQDDFKDVTLTGRSIVAYGLQLVLEALTTGRVGTLIDMPKDPVPNARPYWVLYTAEQIVNWKVDWVGGAPVLTRVVLREILEQEDPDDEFNMRAIPQYRVLELLDGKYTVTLYTQNKDDKSKFDKGETVTPLRRAEALPYIPFAILNASSVGPDVDHPPLLDLADVNLSHYRTSADHEHGAHFTALPTPYVTGHKLPEGQTALRIGSGEAWILSSPGAAAGMLEFSGAGLGSLAALKEEKRQMMMSLGARMLETQKNVAEAAQTVRMRHAGESSALGVLAEALGQSLTQLVQWHLFWRGMETAAASKASVTMNPDVMDELTADDIRMLVDTWQKGGISKQTLYYNMAWGEWTRPNVKFEEEEAEIQKEKDGNQPEPKVVQIERDPQTGRAIRLVQQ